MGFKLQRLRKLDRLVRFNNHDKNHAWNIWGRDFMLWLIETHEPQYAKTKKKSSKPYISKEELYKAYDVVAQTSNLWLSSSLRDLDIVDECDSECSKDYDRYVPIFVDVFRALANKIGGVPFIRLNANGKVDLKAGSRAPYVQKGDLDFKLDTVKDPVVLAGVLREHLRYFIGRGKIWEAMETIFFNKKDKDDKKNGKDTLLRRFQRGSYRKFDYLKRYSLLVDIFRALEYNKLQEAQNVFNEFHVWYKHREDKYLQENP